MRELQKIKRRLSIFLAAALFIFLMPTQAYAISGGIATGEPPTTGTYIGSVIASSSEAIQETLHAPLPDEELLIQNPGIGSSSNANHSSSTIHGSSSSGSANKGPGVTPASPDASITPDAPTSAVTSNPSAPASAVAPNPSAPASAVAPSTNTLGSAVAGSPLASIPEGDVPMASMPGSNLPHTGEGGGIPIVFTIIGCTALIMAFALYIKKRALASGDTNE